MNESKRPDFIGNLYGKKHGTSHAGGVYTPDGISPTIRANGGVIPSR